MNTEGVIFSSLRLPTSLHNELKKIAERESRSFNSTVKILLEKAVQEKREAATA